MSQYNEDEIISDFFGADYVGSFLDVGAGENPHGSNTHALITRGWQGYLLEPNPDSFLSLFDRYRKTPGVMCVNAAMSSDGRLLTFSPCGDLSSAIVHGYNTFIIPSVIPQDFPGPFDFMSVDCEAMDQEIIGALVPPYPRLLCYEHDLPMSPPDENYTRAWAAILERLGFTTVVGKTVGNTLVTRG